MSGTPMVLVFNTSLGDLTVELPFGSPATVNVVVDWGDNTSDTYTTDGTKTHTYAVGGIYTVQISGSLSRFGATATLSRPELTKCLSFGGLGLTSLQGAFRDCANLTQVPDNIPTTATSLADMFRGATSFNQDISMWGLANITDAARLFNNATAFNQNLTSWCVGNFETEPSQFSTGSPLTSGNKPVWGTCPSYVANGAITFVGSATGIDSTTLPTHQSGDFLLAFAFRNGAGGIVQPAGWTTIANLASGSRTARLSYRIATSSGETSGTWSGATSSIFLVYRGVDITNITNLDSTGNATTADVYYSANRYWQGLSRVVAFAGHSSTNTALGTTPGALTLITNPVNVSSEAAAFQSATDAFGSWPLTFVSVGGTTAGWFTYVLRLRAPIRPSVSWSTIETNQPSAWQAITAASSGPWATINTDQTPA